ncbi:sensor domain-containing phosphodiesterase [Halalkalibacillus halophilus]|uniref:sensor domain-containing phosphodiesterase n=1 Tax=Halalkalibacillus halophilus TaxID=392827 RepID=UPI00042A1B0F|nr:EAL domain-containing protein [Halalkalibacillus halophilus]
MKENNVDARYRLPPKEFAEGYQEITYPLQAGKSLREVLMHTIQFFEKKLGKASCALLILDEDENKFIDCLSYSMEESRFDNLNFQPVHHQMGSFGPSVIRRELVVSSNILQDERWQGYEEIVSEQGLQSSWSIPVLSPNRDKVVASFTVFSEQQEEPTEEEVMWVEAYHELLSLMVNNYIATEFNTVKIPLQRKTPKNVEEKEESREDTVDNLIRIALNRGQFIPYYQPIISKDEEEMYGVEVLARWLHPEDGIKQPSSFISDAEEQKLIHHIDDMVFRKACIDLKRMMEQVNQTFRVSVNVSALNIMHPKFIERIKSVLSDTGFPPELLSIEITESALMKNLKDVAKVMTELKELGIRFSIDDFGVSYSSLNYLKYLPVESIKLDRTFVNDITVNAVDRQICKTVIQLAKDLKMNVVAEGVETSEHLEIIREFGCNIFQGYYFSKPVTYEELKYFLLD